MQWSQHRDQLQSLALKGRPIPALESFPELWPELVETYDAFWHLSRSRQIGMGLGPIPMSEIAAWLSIFEMDDPTFFVKAVYHLDGIWLQHEKKATERKTKKANSNTGPQVPIRKPKRGSRATSNRRQ